MEFKCNYKSKEIVKLDKVRALHETVMRSDTGDWLTRRRTLCFIALC